jgi:hypothetical protein
VIITNNNLSSNHKQIFHTLRPSFIQLNQLQQQQQAADENEDSNTLHPLRGQLLSSRPASSNRDSSLDDSGVVDDHEDNQEPEPEPENQQLQSSNMEVRGTN